MAKKKTKAKPTVPSWMRHAWWAVPLLALLVYIPSFSGQFTLDDKPIIEDNVLIRSLDHLPKIWTSHYWAGKIDSNDKSLYRPLTLTTYSIQYAITKDNPVPYHILNILLHALACFALMRLVHLLFNDYRLTLLSGVFFAIHPIHTEAVSGIVGRAELMAALFILTAGICYHHWRENGLWSWMAGLIISTAAAITSKEHGFMLPLTLGLQEAIYYYKAKKYQWGNKRIWMGIGSVFIVSVVLWLIRSQFTGLSVPHEQWLAVTSTDRMATSLRTIGEYLFLHIIPLKLSADYWTDEVPIVGFTNLQVILSFLIIVGLLISAIWQRKKLIPYSWGVIFFFLTLLPVSNLLFAAGFLKAERILYIPSIGIIVALAALLVRLLNSSKGKIVAYVIAAVFMIFFIARTWLRAGDWHNNLTLAEATLKTSPGSPRFNNMMGLEMEHQDRHEEALAYYEKAVRSNPNHVPAMVNLATEYKHFNRNEEAIALLEKAIVIDPDTYMAYVNLMSVYRAIGDYDNNLAVGEKALERFPDSAPVLWNAANAYHLKNNMPRANELRAKALKIDPTIGGKQ